MLHIINIYTKTYFNLKYSATNTQNKKSKKKHNKYRRQTIINSPKI